MPNKPYGHQPPAFIRTHTHTHIFIQLPVSHVCKSELHTESDVTKTSARNCMLSHVSVYVCETSPLSIVAPRKRNSIRLIGKAFYITSWLCLRSHVRIHPHFISSLSSTHTHYSTYTPSCACVSSWMINQ